MEVLLLIVVLAAWSVQAVLAGVAASRKGRSFNAWTLVALVFGPIVILLALLVPQRRLYG